MHVKSPPAHRIAIAFVLTLLCVRAHGVVLCVADSTGLYSAFGQALVLAQNGIGTEIRIKQPMQGGSYSVTDPPGSDAAATFGDLTLAGGYSSDPLDNCSEANRVVTPANTPVALNRSTNAGFEIVAVGNMKIEGLKISTNKALIITASANSDTSVEVYKNIISKPLRVASSTDDPVRVSARIINNVILAGAYCGLDLSNSDFGKFSAYVENNTISNSSDGICTFDVEIAYIYNNIIWGNSLHGITDSANYPSHITLVSNILQSNNSMSMMPTEVGTLSVDPQFVSPALGDYHLQPTSPAVNSGAPSQPDEISCDVVSYTYCDTDLDGNPRIRGALIDRGAYETAVAPVIVVNSIGDFETDPNDPTQITLRHAINLANQAPGTQTIKFSIAGANKQIHIDLLPNITESLTIDGYSPQVGAVPGNAPEGFNAVVAVSLTTSSLSLPWAFHVPAGSEYDKVTLTVSGLKFNTTFTQAAIHLNGGYGHFIWGNEFATNGIKNEVDVLVNSDAVVNGIHNGGGVRIGGDQAWERNLLSGANTAVTLQTSNNQVINNLIGPGRNGGFDGMTGNTIGIHVTGGDKNTIRGNVISGNSNLGLLFTSGASSNQVINNVIGMIDDPSCTLGCGLGNGQGGIRFDATSNGNWVGGYGNGTGDNTIGYNGGAGVRNSGQVNALYQNVFHDNAGLAIDLDDNGIVNLIDNDPSNTAMANSSTNYPVLHGTQLGEDSLHLTVTGTLASLDNSYTIALFANDSCDGSEHGEGQERVAVLSGIDITNATNLNGTANFAIPVVTSQSLTGRYLTALATTQLGNTSEFSRCMPADRIFSDGTESLIGQ